MSETLQMVDELDASIDRVLIERNAAQSKLDHTRLALRLIAEKTTDEHAKNIALAALDVVGGG